MNTRLVPTGAPSTPSTAAPSDPWRVTTSRSVHPATRTDGEPLVAAIAAGLAAVSVPWELSTGTAPAERSYHLLLATDRYDAWLIYWPPGTGLDAHDHGGSEGAFSVVAGVLHEEVPASDPRSPGASRQVEPGQTVHFDADHVHSVVNRGPAGATSVHVYSPPLRSMGFYAADADGRLVVERVDDVGRARR